MKGRAKAWARAWLFLLLCGWLVSPAGVEGALERANIEMVKQIGGSALSVTLRGNTAYLGLGSSLHLLDVRDPADPRLLGKVALPGLVMDVAVLADGTRTVAYVAAGRAGLRVVDVSHPSFLKEKGSYETGGYAESVYVLVEESRTVAYVAAGEEGLVILDVSDPASPREVGRYETQGYASGVFAFVRDGKVYAYLAAGEQGVVAVDVSEPATPRPVSTLPLPGFTSALSVSGNYAYVAAGLAGLVVVDLADPESPWEVGRYDTEGFASDVAISFPHAYVADGKRGLRVIKVENPLFLWEVGTYRTVENGEPIPTFTFGVAVSGVYAYVANGRVGLKVVEFLNPMAAKEVGEYMEAVTYASGFFSDGPGSDVCVTAGIYGFDVLKMVDSLSLERIDAAEGRSFYYIRPQFEDTIFLHQGGLFIAGGYPRPDDTGGHLFLTMGEFGLEVGDIKPDFTGTAGSFDTEGFASGVFVSFSPYGYPPNRDPSNPYAYVAVRDRGLMVLEVVNPPPHSHPMPISEVSRLFKPDVDWGAEAVFVAARGANTYAYVAAGDTGLVIVDVTDPANLTPENVVGFLRTPGPAKAVFVSAQDNKVYAYVAAGDLLVVDVTDPTKPQLRGRYDVPGQATGVYLQTDARLAYVVNQQGTIIDDPAAPPWRSPEQEGSLLAVDISDPDFPTDAGRLDTRGQILGVFVAGGYAYVSDGDGGLLILRHTPAAPSGPDLVVDPSNLWFGESVVGTNQELTVTLRNRGDRDLLVSGLSLQGEGFSLGPTTPAAPFSLAADEAQEIRVGFLPDSAGLRSGTVTVLSDDPENAALRIPLAGRGIPAPDIRASETGLTFGEVAEGDSGDLELMLFNDGDGILTVKELSIDNAVFEVVSPSPPFQVAPGGGSQRVTLRFSPLSSGAQAGTLRILSNDPDEGVTEVSLAGNGAQVQLTINGGAGSTTKRKVSVDLSVPETVVRVRFSNNGSKWSSWKKGSKARPWRLSKGEGAKRVWGEFKTRSGRLLKASDTIALERMEKKKRK